MDDVDSADICLPIPTKLASAKKTSSKKKKNKKRKNETTEVTQVELTEDQMLSDDDLPFQSPEETARQKRRKTSLEERDDDRSSRPARKVRRSPTPSCSGSEDELFQAPQKEDLKTKVARCLAVLEPLYQEFDVLEDMTIPPDRLIRMLDAMMELWTPVEIQNKNNRVNHALLIVESCLGIDEKEDPLPSAVELLMDQHIWYPVHNLQLRFNHANLINNDSYDRSAEFTTKFQSIFMLMSYAIEMYYNSVLYAHRAKNPELDMSDSSVGVLRYLPLSQQQEMNDFTKFLIYCLLRLQTRRYRRFKGCVYRPIYNSAGYYTNAWEKHQTIEEFVWSSVDVDRQSHLWKTMFSKGCVIPEQTIKVLKFIKTSYFPDLVPSRYLSSWSNGIYNHAEAKFYSYDAANPYSMGIRLESEEVAGVESAAIEELRRMKAKLPKYEALIEAVAKQAEGEARNGNTRKATVFCAGHFCSSIYIDQVFVDQSNVPWQQIPTPTYQKILDSQNFDEDTCKWMYVLPGRGLYWCGDMNRENWQIATLLIGHGGTGKSTILKYLRQFFKVDNVGLLSNNIERQWAMSSLVDRENSKYIVIGSEVKADLQWDQAEFNQCAACEEMLVMQKHRDTYIIQFKAPIFMAANEMIKCWKNTGDSLKRRLVVIPFRYFVPKNHVNPNLMDDLMREFPMWIQKINLAYREATAQYRGKDIWEILPKELKNASDYTMQSVHPLQHFFAEKTNIVYGEDLYVPQAEFMKEFKTFCENYGYSYSKISWHSDFFKPVFDNQGIRVEKTLKAVNGSSRMKPGQYVIGMNFTNVESDAASPDPSQDSRNK